MKKVILGFDLGVTSVGWSILDEEKNIINYGVRLFDDAAEPKTGNPRNTNRREKRGLRRRISRIRTRKDTLIKLFTDEKLIVEVSQFYKIIDENQKMPLELKNLGLIQEISKSDAMICLYHYIQHRGFMYIDAENYESSIKDKKDIVKTYPSQQQFDFFQKNGYCMGAKLNQKFSVHDWKKEIQAFLDNQKYLSKEFKQKYLNLFEKVRDYSQGPGSEKSPTKYGLFQKDENTNKVIKKGDNLWDALIGRCSRYPDEYRALRNCASAELFNLLNDLNNLRIDNQSDWRISIDQKEAILNELFIKLTKTVSVSFISKILGIKKEELKGFRINKDKKPLFTNLNNLITVLKVLRPLDKKYDMDFKPYLNPSYLDVINSIIEIKAKHNKNIDKMINLFQECMSLNFNKKISDENLGLLIKDIKDITKTHSLSIKALNEDIPLLFNAKNGENQMNLHINNPNKNLSEFDLKLIGRKYIPTDLFDNEILSPTVKRVFRQALKVLNKIIEDKNLDISKIVIEMVRDKNSKEEKQRIDENQNYFEKTRNSYKEKYKDLFSDKKIPNQVIEKLLLYDFQQGCDIYDGTKLSINEIITNPNYTQIDHIIPYGISFDNSRSNKVLTLRENNQLKGDNTPYQWLQNGINFDQLKKRANTLYAEKAWYEDKNKLKNLTYMLDPLKDEDFLKSFIGRNLSDTSYTTKLFFSTINKFFKLNKKDVTVISVNGKFTNYLRNRVFNLKKDRELYKHHAVDATMVAYAGTIGGNFLKTLRYLSNSDFSNQKLYENINLINNKTGEVILDVNKLFDDKRTILNILENKEPQFSRMLNTKNNISFYDETIYSFRRKKENDEEFEQVSKYNLFKIDIKKLKKLFIDNDEKELKNFILYESAIDKFNILKAIFNQYFDPDAKNANPFLLYMKNIYNEDDPKYLKFVDDNNKFIIKDFRFINNVPKNNVFVVNKDNKTSKRLQGFTGFSCLYCKCYQLQNRKYWIIPINVNVLKYDDLVKKTIIDDKKLNNILKDDNMINCQFLFDIHRGTTFKNKLDNSMVYVTGYSPSQQKIEIKPIWTTNKIGFNLEKDKQKHLTINSLLEQYQPVRIDILGKIYKI